MKLPLAGADFTFPLLPHDKVLALVSLLELDGVDIGLFEGRSHLWPSDMFADTSKNARTLSAKLKDNNLKAADIFLQGADDFVSMASNHPNAKIRDKARTWYLHSLEFTNLCEGKHTTGLPGVYFDEEPADISYGRACEQMAWRCEQAKQHGIAFSIEPHIGSIVPSPASAQKLVHDVPGLSLTLDYTHFTKVGMADIDIEPLIKHASHFHARGAAKGYLQCSFSRNTIDYARVLQVMKDTGYSGFIGIEYIWVDWENCNEVDNVAEVIQMRNFFTEKMKEI